jgi:hypothetical protein
MYESKVLVGNGRRNTWAKQFLLHEKKVSLRGEVGPPAVQSNSDLNKQNHPLTSKQNLKKKKQSLTILIPKTEKKISAKKCRKKQETKYTNLDSF